MPHRKLPRVDAPDPMAYLDWLNDPRPLVVAMTGAGISAESGLKTFRDHDGLWENHRPEDVANIDAWHRDPQLVQRFYNQRRQDAWTAQPNPGHLALAQLQDDLNVVVVTQNVDSLHERAGSARVLHLHGELRKVHSDAFPELVYDAEDQPIAMGDCCERGSQLRPHVVWFGEAVPLYGVAVELTRRAWAVLVVGTSLAVYPAAGLVDEAPQAAELHVVNPRMPALAAHPKRFLYEEAATTGVAKAAAAMRANLLGAA